MLYKVRCICVEVHEDDSGGAYPEVGGIYTVVNEFICDDGVDHIELAEITQHGDDDWYPGFVAEHFKRIVEKSTDAGMAVLREILDRESYVTRIPTKQD